MKWLVLIFALLLLGMAAVMGGGYFLWGGPLESGIRPEALRDWLAAGRSYAWLGAIGLLAADLLLPIPATGVMAAVGQVYGFALGTVIAASGYLAAGWLGYGLARLGSPLVSRRISPREAKDLTDFIERWGGWAIILTRMAPILAETMTIVAGLAGMSGRRYGAALVVGTLPTAAAYVFLGSVSTPHPGWGLAAAVVLPVLVWPLVAAIIRR